MTSITQPVLQPLVAAQRLQILDVVRGFALLGILLMNMEAFFGPLLLAGSGLDPSLTGIDRWADALIYIFVQSKFYTLFSLLFGMGFAVMAQRAESAARPFAGLYWRRALALLAFGVIHAIFVWSGDILMTYALVSLGLLVLRPVRGGWSLAIGVLAFFSMAGWMLLYGGLDWAMSLSAESAKAWDAAMGEQAKLMNDLIAGQQAAYGHGTYLQATQQRLRDFGFNLTSLVAIGPTVLGLFLIGKWFVESGAIVQPQQHARLFTGLRWVVLPLGVALMLGAFALSPHIDQIAMNLRGSVAFALGSVASLLMSLGYLAWVLRGLQAGGVTARILGWLAPAGRMALSNYLMQSVVCTSIAYAYGLGWFGHLPRAWQVVLALILFLAQVIISHVWLTYFRFGPMEWLWRSLTYLKPQPMRQRAE